MAKQNAIGVPATVDVGGTGAVTLTDGGIVLGSGTGAVTVTSQPSSGQLLIGSTGADPVLAAITGGTGVTVTNGAGTISIAADNNGDVVASGTSTDNAIARYDSTTGKLIQNSGVIIDDSNNITGVNQLDIDSANGLDVNPGSDIDADLVTVGVTGTPKISWDESSNGFRLNKALVVGTDGEGDLTHTINGATVNSDLEIHSEDSQDLGGLTIHRHTNTALWGAHIVNLRSNGIHGTPTIVVDNDVVSRYLSAGFDGTDYNMMAEMRTEVDGTPSANDMPGRFVWLTSPDGTQVPVEGMRLDSTQKLTLLNLDVDNININGNTISTTSGALTLSPISNATVKGLTHIYDQYSSNSGVTNQIKLTNTESTNALSSAGIFVKATGASGGDAFYSLEAGVLGYSIGIDNSNSDTLKITNSTTGPSAGSTLWNMTTAGELTLPLQPSFFAYLPSSVANITGDNTAWQLGTGTALTEEWDQGGDFNTDGTFTCPITSNYFLGTNFLLQSMTAGTNVSNSTINTSNHTYSLNNNSSCFTGNNQFNMLTTVDLDAADTAVVNIVVSGGTKIVDIFGGVSRRSVFYGWLPF